MLLVSQTLFLVILKKAIIEPENVIAPTAAPIDISIKLPSLILPCVPRLNATDLKRQLWQQKPQLAQPNCEIQQLIRHSCHWYL